MAVEANQDPGQNPPPGLFTATHWSVVWRAKDKSDTALNTLFQSYRSPLLTWLRTRPGLYSRHDAEDIVHGFFSNLLRRDFLREVGQEKGKFRSFLLTSLRNHLKDLRREEGAEKRGGGQVPVSLQETDENGQPLYDPAASGAAPDLEFDRAWARGVLANALRHLEGECARTGHAALCTALEPVMFADETADPYRDIGERLGMTEGAVKVAAHRIRGRLRGLIREEIRQTVDNDQDFQDELHYLAGLFGK